MRTRVLSVLSLVVAALLLPAPAAQAQGRVTVANESGAAAVDPTYATRLTVRGSGFQSVRGGHGGVYVFFGTVRSGWRPSQGGRTGSEYFYVPDSESRNNQGYQRYVAFPGSSTASSANGGTMSASGDWSVTLTVPGATFRAQDRNGRVSTIDCRRVTCGVITVGAHGVASAPNETFTPVRVTDLYGGQPPATGGSTPAPGTDPGTTEAPGPEAGTDEGPEEPDGGPKGKPARPKLDVDRASATAGHVLPFAATGLPPRAQVSAVLDDGVAAAGPFLVGDDGRLSGVITIPADTDPGTHELRLFGIDDAPTVRFAVAAGEVEASGTEQVAEVEDDGVDRAGVLFLAGAVLVLLLAVVRLLVSRKGARRAT